MIFQFLSDLLKALLNSSGWQKLILVILLAVACVGLVGWERWTAGFRLTKLERSVRIIEQVSHIQGVDTNQVLTLSHHIMKQLAEVLRPDGESIAPMHPYSRRLVMGIIPWLLMSILLIPSALRKAESVWSLFIGVFVIGGIVAAGLANLPEGQWPWRYVLWYPIAVFLISFFCGLIAAILSGAKSRNVK